MKKHMILVDLIISFLKIDLVHISLFSPYSDFFNWNKVKIRYCDGSSFASHPDNESKVSPVEVYLSWLLYLACMMKNDVKKVTWVVLSLPLSQSRTKFFFRGQLIWDTIMDELLAIGMSNAREVPTYSAFVNQFSVAYLTLQIYQFAQFRLQS